jgi:hypothetical protein
MRLNLLLLSLALGAEAAPHLLKADKRSRSLKDDKARVSKHLHTLLKKAPDMHKEGLQKEIERFATSSTSDIDSWYGYPMTLDWIVDVYFDSSQDTGYKVILDSGSSNLAVAIESCTNCGKASTTLDLTTDDDMCIEVTYGSGEWSGVEVESTYVGLSSEVSTDTTLAGITYQDDFFSGGSSYCGILGMAYEGIAEGYSSSSCSSSKGSKTVQQKSGHRDLLADSEDATPLMYALTTAGSIPSNTFAVAMCDDDADVSLGGVESSMYTGDIDYATTQKTFGEYYGYYLIYTSGITVGTTSVDVENINLYGGLVVDTGTTLHYVPSATATAIEKEVKSTVGSAASTSFFSWESCVTSDELSDFPTITYTFAESDETDATTFDVSLSPKQYLLSYDECYYWGFESSSLGIYGNIGMKDKVVVFDIENTQIGFGTGVCTDTLMSEYKSPKQLLGEVVAEVQKRSSSDLALGLLSAMAVVGTVLAAAFVVINKVVKKTNNLVEEQETLLPPL